MGITLVPFVTVGATVGLVVYGVYKIGKFVNRREHKTDT